MDVSTVWDQKTAMLHAHESQFYEWLPYNGQYETEVPGDETALCAWLSGRMTNLSRRLADRHRAAIVAAYGPERGTVLDRIEAFEAGEYGAPLDDEARVRLFPMASTAREG